MRNSPLDINKLKAEVDRYCVRDEYDYRYSQAYDTTMEKDAMFEYKKWIG